MMLYRDTTLLPTKLSEEWCRKFSQTFSNQFRGEQQINNIIQIEPLLPAQ